jgi:hypothetical protein
MVVLSVALAGEARAQTSTLVVAGHANNASTGQVDNVSFHVAAPIAWGNPAVTLGRRFCLWPADVAELEAALRAAASGVSGTLWSRKRHLPVPFVWSDVHEFAVTAEGGQLVLAWYAGSTNGAAGGDNTLADLSVEVRLSAAEARDLSAALTAWRAAPAERELFRR